MIHRFAISVLLSLFLASTLLSVEEFSVDIRLVRALTEIKMYDYAVLQLDLMAEKYGDSRKDLLAIERGRTLCLSGDRDKGEKVLSGIARSSPHFPAACLAVAEMAYRRGDLKKTGQAYSDYFAMVKPADLENRYEREVFARAVRLYSKILEKEGKGGKAAEVLGYLGEITGEEFSSRQMDFVKIQALLSAQEEKFSNRKPVNQKVLEGALKKLKAFQWQMDGIAAASYVEAARVHVMLRQNDEALKVLQAGSEFMKQMEGVLAQKGNAGSSPLSGAYHYFGKAFKGKAFEAFGKKRRRETQENLERAAKCFQKVVKDYPDSLYCDKAMIELGKCRNLLSKEFDIEIGMSAGEGRAAFDMQMEQAGTFINAGDFKKAAPFCLQAVRSARGSRRFPEAGMRFVVCYAKLERFWEARAIASHMVELFPESAETADSLYRLGAFLYQASKQQKKPGVKSKYLNHALDLWSIFVDVCPTHSKAPDIAFLIAEEQYRQAADIASEAESRRGRAAEQLKEQARQEYLKAVPKYEVLLDSFAFSDRAVRALYKLGWIYYSTDQPEKSAENFLHYCSQAENPEEKDDRLEAKFRAAEQLMLNGNPEDAANHLKELISFLQPRSKSGFNAKTPTARRIKQDAASYLGWAYDLAGQEYSEALSKFRVKVDSLKDNIEQYTRRIENLEKAVSNARSDAEESRSQFEDLREVLGMGFSDISGLARETASGLSESVDAVDEKEKKFAARNLDQKTDQLAGKMLLRMKDAIKGEKIAREQEYRQLKIQIDSLSSQYRTASQKCSDLEKNLEAVRKEKVSVSRRFKDLSSEYNEAEKQVVRTQAALEQVEEELENARELADSRDVEKKKKAVQFYRELEPRLESVRAARDGALEKRDALGVRGVRDEIESLDVQLGELNERVRSMEVALVESRRDRSLLEKEMELAQCRLAAVEKALEHTSQMDDWLALPTESRQKEPPLLKRTAGETEQAFKTVMEKGLEKCKLIESTSQQRIAETRSKKEHSQKALQALQRKMAPVKAKFDSWKRKALTELAGFVEKFPDSKHLPENMARIGTVYMELGQFAKAAEALTALSSSFPDSRAGKQALFDLGRAQFEIGEYDKAKKAFGQLLDSSVSSLPSPNLAFISEKMLSSGAAEISLKASREILARSASPAADGTGQISPAMREHTLFRAGRAAFLREDYASVLDYHGTLLKENEKTGYFYDAKFDMGWARNNLPNPDPEGALRDFSEILQYATDPPVVNRALCSVGRILAAKTTEADLKKALARFQQVVLLADSRNEANMPWIESAVYESARLYTRLGNDKERDRMVALYRQNYPGGKYQTQISSLQ